MSLTLSLSLSLSLHIVPSTASALRKRPFFQNVLKIYAPACGMPKPATHALRLPWQDGVPQTPRSMQPRRTASASVDGTNSPPKRRTGGKHRRTAADAPFSRRLSRSPVRPRPPLSRFLPHRRLFAHSPSRPSVCFHLSIRPAPSARKITCFFFPKSF